MPARLAPVVVWTIIAGGFGVAVLSAFAIQRDGRWLDAITSRGLVLESLNCSAFPLHPRLGQEHTQIIRDTICLAELLGVDSIVTQSGCPGDSEYSRLPH